MSYAAVSHFKPPRIALLVSAIAFLAHVLYPVSVHAPLTVLGILTAVSGFSLMLRGWWLFRRLGTAICPTEPSTALITDDVYALTRNPMYLGIALMVAATGLGTGSLSFYIAALAFVVVIDRVYCPYEERKGIAEFGEAYLRYASSVRRW